MNIRKELRKLGDEEDDSIQMKSKMFLTLRFHHLPIFRNCKILFDLMYSNDYVEIL